MREATGKGTGRRPRHPLPPGLRAVLVVALVAVLAVGERSSSGLALDSAPLVHGLPTWGVAVLLGMGTLLVLLALLAGLRRGGTRGGAGRRKRSNPLLTALAWLLALAAAVALPRSSALAHLRDRLTPARPPGATTPTPPRLPAAHSEPVLALVVVAAVLAGAAALLLLRRRRAPGAPPGPVPAEHGGEEGARLLAGAAAAGLGRLRADAADDRSAVLAAYAAMEEVLTRAGAGRHEAETPAELLARVRQSGLAGAGAAERLVAVFGRARWSSAPVARADRDEAEAALAALAALHARSARAGADAAS